MREVEKDDWASVPDSSPTLHSRAREGQADRRASPRGPHAPCPGLMERLSQFTQRFLLAPDVPRAGLLEGLPGEGLGQAYTHKSIAALAHHRLQALTCRQDPQARSSAATAWGSSKQSSLRGSNASAARKSTEEVLHQPAHAMIRPRTDVDMNKRAV